MAAFNWKCPYCNHAQTVIEERQHIIINDIDVGKTVEKGVKTTTSAIGCSNSDCNRISIIFHVTRDKTRQEINISNRISPKTIFHRQILPEGSSKIQPDYIPVVLVEDYTEACLIRNLSPKSSATLARRCIQGMIRDFCGITKGRLIDEINALRETVNCGNAPAGVTLETIEAIDHVRSIGNIGAHMEKDIDLIVPVDPEEAQALIDLIEMLFEEWYVARHVRQQKLAAISRIGAEKKQLIEDGRAERRALAAPASQNPASQ